MRIAIALVISGILSIASLSFADVFRYTDGTGKTHYVDSLDKIPEKFRTQAEAKKPLPQISKVPASNMPDNQVPAGETKTSKTTATAEVTKQRIAGPKVEVFITSWCGYCRALEQQMKIMGIPYKRYDIEKDVVGRRLYQSIGGDGSVPWTKVGNTVIPGYEPDGIYAAYKNLKKN